jgi:uncharacterized protein (TIGR02421 family)
LRSPAPGGEGRFLRDDHYARDVRMLGDRLVAAQRGIRILDSVAWDEGVRNAFFSAGCREEPLVDAEYYARRPLTFDTDRARAEFRAIERDADSRLGPSDPAARILRRMCNEYVTVLAMLEARGTPAFAEHSASLYGRSTDALYPGQASLADLAGLLDQALRDIDASAFLESTPRDITSDQAVVLLQQRLDHSMASDGLSVRVSADDGIVADAAAGSDYIKLKQDTMFNEQDLYLLEAHEGWVHVGTTLNGRAQPICTFLSKGTPATAVTQEGLAVLVEVLSFRSHPLRLRRVTDRIRAIQWAEEGVSFLEVFGRFRDEGRNDNEAYTMTVRVFRGSTPRNGPFTKDLSYSKGFVSIYNFIRLAVRRGRLDRIPLLFVGKVLLEEIGLIAELAAEGLVAPPRFLPPAFADLSALTAWMAYSNFLNRLDLGRVEADYVDLLGG